MAFKTMRKQAQDESWKSQAFINFWLPSVNGGRRKLGSIPLKENRPAEAQLIQFLSANPDSIEDLLSGMEVDFQLADDGENTGFVLPSVPQTKESA